MALAEEFQEIIDSLPSDWSDLEFDLRVDEDRYIDAATLVVQINAQPYSHHDWHWHVLVAHQFGHAAAAPAVHGTLAAPRRVGDPRRARAARAAHGPRGDDPGLGAARVVPARVQAPARAVATVARVVAVFDDLLLGSNVLGMLRAAGHEAELAGQPEAVRAAGAQVLVVDLASGGFDGVALVEALRGRGELEGRARSASTPTSTTRRGAARGARASTSSCRARAWRARGPRSWPACFSRRTPGPCRSTKQFVSSIDSAVPA